MSGDTLAFGGRLLTLDRREARALAERLGAVVADDVGGGVTVFVSGAEAGAKLRRVEQINSEGASRIRVLDEDAFCALAGLPTPTALRSQYQARRDLLERYPQLGDARLRYLEKWGLIRAAHRTHAETYYAFPDVAVIRQAAAELASGATFRATIDSLLAARAGQLAFDFRLDADPAKVVQLTPRPPLPLAPLMNAPPAEHSSLAEQYFVVASVLDDGDPAHRDEAAAAYRRALVVDPDLVPALINLANLHYARDEIAEAQALYERARSLEPDVFEAHYNLGNIFHDLGRYRSAQACYQEALRLNPGYAEAHFYLAVSLEKAGLSAEARPHWRRYQQLAPDGEWVELAKEFSDP